MGNEIITLVKDTSLANTIANKEIIMMAKEYSAKGLIWPLFSTALFFLVFVGALTILFNWAEKSSIISAAKEADRLWRCSKLPVSEKFWRDPCAEGYLLDLEQGEALAIIGSSGSGKQTSLRCLNFLERPDTGVIKVNGETMWDAADPATQKESEIRKNGSTLVWCSRTSTCSRSTRPCRT